MIITFGNRICLKEGSSVFGVGGEEGRGDIILFILCSHHVLCVVLCVPSDFSQVLNVLLKGVPNSTTLLSHMVAQSPPFSSI